MGQILINIINILRSFSSGLFAIIFVLHLQYWKIGPLEIGLFAAVSVVISGTYTIVFTRLASRFSPYLFLIISAVLMVISGLIFSLANNIIWFWIACLCGFIPPAGGLFVNALEEGIIANVLASKRTRVFAIYGMLGTAGGALGALSATIPSLMNWGEVRGIHYLFWFYTSIALISLVVSLMLFKNQGFVTVEKIPQEKKLELFSQKLDGKALVLVRKMALLFVADSFGSGIVTSTLLIFWFHHYFHFNLGELGIIFFLVDITSAISFPIAEVISRYIGLLNTAVFTHIPSSLLLVAIPFVPNGYIAAALLITRGILVEMDVPTRQSYLASIVNKSGRAQAAGMTSLGKQIGRTAGPILGGSLLAASNAVAPFVAGGVVKIAYDLALWRSFKKVKQHNDDK